MFYWEVTRHKSTVLYQHNVQDTTATAWLNRAIVDPYSTRMRKLPQLYPLDAQFGTAPTEQDAARVLGDQPCDSPSHILVEHDWKHYIA